MTRTWEDSAACREIGLDTFHPEGRGTALAAAEREAKAVCLQCPVRRQCLTYALDREGRADRYSRSGIWGGLNPQERAALRTAA
ncbi:WhiB family transcriptional regulator [Streptomyces erythrochromogenes]|uniref:WhiB family transcriptional regulator n=1 Tax=Streptomyces erythrochromogenes TaxID=285574 RepID=UPI00331F43A2